MTERLYYHDSYTRQFTASVRSYTAAGLILDRTCFYPTGGGQPHDTGTIGGVQIVDVLSQDDGGVLHILDGTLAATAGEVPCMVDWPRRFDHMQHHTGQHLLTQAFVSVTGAQTVGFHLSADSVTIDLDQAVTAAQIDAVETLANQIVQENRAVTARLIDPDDASAVRMRKMPEKIYTAGLRVIEIADFDLTACGGTHVAHTGEIALIKVLKAEKRGDKTRVEFRCGMRAFDDYRLKSGITGTLMAEMTCGLHEIIANVSKARADLRAAQSALKAASNRLVAYESAELLAQAVPHAAFRVVRAVFDDRDPAELKLLVTQLVATPGIVALIGAAGEKAQVIFARSADLPHDLNPAFKAAVDVIGGRGGGRPEWVQGGGVSATVGQIQQALHAALDRLD